MHKRGKDKVMKRKEGKMKEVKRKDEEGRREVRKRKNERKMKDAYLRGENRGRACFNLFEKLAALTVKRTLF